MPDVIVDNLPYLLGGLGLTMQMAACAALGGSLLGLAIGLIRHARVPFLNELATIYVAALQGTPLLVVLLVSYFAFPELLGYQTSAFSAAILGFTLFSSAYISEDIRAGLASVSQNLHRAALATGLTPAQALRFVVIPIGLRKAIPAIFNQYVRLFKYTSMASIIGVAELTGRSMLVNARELQPIVILAMLAVTYLVFCYSISLIGRLAYARLA